jgi:DNA-binding transcriptional LysR family regulator
MDISLLKCFLTVSECLNFSGAAERLFITQSTVSRRIAALESELNVKLFERNASGVSLTEAGKACVSDAREIVRKYEDMREKTQRYHSGVSGTLRVFCDGEHDRDLIAEACAEIRKTYPDIRIHIMRGCSGPAVEQLVQGEADIILAVTSELYNVKNLVEIPIKPMHWVMVLPAAHPLAKKTGGGCHGPKEQRRDRLRTLCGAPGLRCGDALLRKASFLPVLYRRRKQQRGYAAGYAVPQRRRRDGLGLRGRAAGSFCHPAHTRNRCGSQLRPGIHEKQHKPLFAAVCRHFAHHCKEAANQRTTLPFQLSNLVFGNCTGSGDPSAKKRWYANCAYHLFSSCTTIISHLSAPLL